MINLLFGFLVGTLFLILFDRLGILNWLKEQMMIWSIERMGHMLFWWKFGFEWWGTMRPAQMTTPNGKIYKPLFLGIWKETKELGVNNDK